MDNNYISASIFIGVISLLANDMTSKFIAGFITGIIVSTKYDFKPYVNLIEEKIINLQKELETKKEELQQKEVQKQNDWNFNWPWTEKSKKD